MSTGTNKPSLADLAHINPLIDSDGETYKVSSVLNTLAVLFRDHEDRIDEAALFGLSAMLDTCAAALRQMDRKGV